MYEKKYLKKVLKIIDSPNRLRVIFYQQIAWIGICSLGIAAALDNDLITKTEAALAFGIFLGTLFSGVERIYHFNIIRSHLNRNSIQQNIEQNGL